MEIARKIAKLSRNLNYEAIGSSTQDRVKYLLLDYLGVAIRGSRSDSSQLIQRFLSTNNSTAKGVPVIGTEMVADAPFAALANGAASHSLELDDVVNAASLHPAVTIMSAALSAGSMVGSTGRELLEGIIAGYELTVKLGIALDPAAHYEQGFHPTGTCGTFGAALASAKVLNLDEDGIAMALGIAGSQASGSMEFLADGSFTKRFHGGWAAHAGLIAALLAREGFTGPVSIFEGKHGFLHAYSRSSDPEKVLKRWGEPYEILKTSIKPHACCRYKQGPIDCILEIVRKNKLSAEDIEKVVVGILKAGSAIVAEPRESKLNPQSIVDAQFSMPFGAAIAIIYGQAFLEQYCAENISSPLVRELMNQVVCVENPNIEKDFPNKWPAEVEILTKDGRCFREEIQYPKGDPENPLSMEELIIKFKKLASTVFSDEQCDEVIKAVSGIEKEVNVSAFMKILAAPR